MLTLLTARTRVLVGVLVACLAGCTGASTSPLATVPRPSSPLPTVVRTPSTSPAASRTTPPASPSTTPSAAPSPRIVGIRYTDPMRYEVTYRVVARNDGSRLDRLIVYQPKPVDWDAQEDVRIGAVTPTPDATRVDEATGNGMYRWELHGRPAAGKTVPFVVTFSLTAYRTDVDIAPEEVRPYRTDSTLYERYTAAERFIESQDPAVTSKAREIGGDEMNPLLLARRFYDFVIDQSTYVRTGTGLHGAKALLASGAGECGDYASLFVALSRASGIPARPVVGYWAQSGLDQTHVWAEFFLEGYGWVPVDPTVGQSSRDPDRSFGHLDNRRVILDKGFNIRLLPAAPDDYVAPFLQVPSWWFWGTGDAGAVAVERDLWSVRRLP